MRKILAICDQEQDYTSRMVEYLSERQNLPFQVEAFTSVESFAEYEARHPVEILLISERSYSEKVESMKIGKVIVLSEEERENFAAGQVKNYPDGTQTIYKYQPTAEVVRETMDCYRVVPRAVSDPETAGKIRRFGVFSPCQAPDTSCFSLILARELAMRGRVLYVNMKPFSGISRLTGNMENEAEDKGSLDDLLYCCRQNTGGIQQMLLEVTEKFKGVDYLPQAISPTDLAMVTGEEWERLFQAIEESGRWDLLVLEPGEGIQDLEEMLDFCQYVFLPVSKSPLADARTREFKRLGICPDGIEVELPERGGNQIGDPLELMAEGPLTTLVKRTLAGLWRY